MTDKQIQRLVHTIQLEIALTEGRSGNIDTMRRIKVGMTRDVYNELDYALQRRVEIQYRKTGAPTTFCGYPVEVIDRACGAPGIFIMREIECDFFGKTEADDDYMS